MSKNQRHTQLLAWLESVLHDQSFDLAPASADASFRSYLRVTIDDDSLIVMDAPPEHEDCEAFLDINQRLRLCALNVPRILSYDQEQGFILMSDLGNEHFLQVLNPSTVGQLYADAIGAMIHMQCRATTNGLHRYDHAMLRREMDLFGDWLVKLHLKLEMDDELQQMLDQVCEFLAESALQQPQVFVHRDYHSRNLMYVPDRNPGILDYQDAVLGPVSYDLASLLKDCYIQWPRDLMDNFAIAYYQQAREAGLVADMSKQDFLRAYDLMGVQRHLKASGIFARLWQRDGKKAYLADIPRTLSYITQVAADYPELQQLSNFIQQRVLPALK